MSLGQRRPHIFLVKRICLTVLGRWNARLACLPPKESNIDQIVTEFRSGCHLLSGSRSSVSFRSGILSNTQTHKHTHKHASTQTHKHASTQTHKHTNATQTQTQIGPTGSEISNQYAPKRSVRLLNLARSFMSLIPTGGLYKRGHEQKPAVFPNPDLHTSLPLNTRREPFEAAYFVKRKLFRVVFNFFTAAEQVANTAGQAVRPAQVGREDLALEPLPGRCAKRITPQLFM